MCQIWALKPLLPSEGTALSSIKIYISAEGTIGIPFRVHFLKVLFPGILVFNACIRHCPCTTLSLAWLWQIIIILKIFAISQV